MNNLVKKLTRIFILTYTTAICISNVIAQEVENENVTVLDEVVVSGERIERSLLDTASSVSIVSSANIETRNLENLSDILSQIANVAPTFDGRGFRIRGISSSSVTGAGMEV